MTDPAGAGEVDCMPKVTNNGTMLAWCNVAVFDVERHLPDMGLPVDAGVPDKVSHDVGLSENVTYRMMRGGLGGRRGKARYEGEKSTQNQGRDRETCITHRMYSPRFCPSRERR
ncbi:MAG TPA: hypothetical protein VFN42_10155 [Acetobacteraceae bacterium]|nr:hypothetical protein [Acetobacteraceae bacterium]